jgi:thymidylate synthase, flavin-dependent
MTFISAKLIDNMGSDLTVVNAARVSFNKESNWEEQDGLSFLSIKDEKLIKYLAKHEHWTPFAHCMITMHVTAPLFVRTQCFKHKVGFTENEISRRYVNDPPRFWEPDVFRNSAESVKQGSSDQANWNSDYWISRISGVYHNISIMYKQMLDDGVCPEQARAILPQSMVTEWYWTGSLAAYARFYKQRTSPHAQKETKELALQIGGIMEKLYPVSWSALVE